MDSRNTDEAKNAALWDEINREHTNDTAAANWALDEIVWGIWSIDESELGVLGDVSGLDVVELGCGTAYFSAWLAKRGARPVGVDVTPAQLETARRMMAETGIEFPLVQADAAETGLESESFDLVLSEYGASIWADPYRWIPEAARLLRPGGRLVFLCNSTLVILCSADVEPARESLQRPQFGMGRFEWPEGGVEWHLAHGEWVDVLRQNGFELERLLELQAPADAETHEYYAYVTAEWARKWPAEEIWVLRKRGG
jgi:SAM-dependent methyltransferase